MKLNTYLATGNALLVLSLTAAACNDAADSDGQHDAAEDALEVDQQSVPGNYVERGGHAVGYRTFEWTDEAGQTREVKSWYPAAGAAPAAAIDYEVGFKFPGWPVPEPTLIHGHALRDAEIDDADRYPLVVFSHGFGMNPEWYSVLTEHLASHGFVVLAPEHQEADWFETVVDASFARPRDIKETLDLAEALSGSGGEFAGGIDMERVAVVGHSYGGYTALAVAGAQIHLNQFVKECATVGEMDPRMFLCGPFMGDADAIAEAAGLDSAPAGEWPAMGDSRVKAIVPIAGDAFLFGKAGLSEVTVPTMAIGGTADTGSPWEWGSSLTYDHVSSQHASLVGFVGGEHMISVNTCSDLPWTGALPEEFQAMLCQDPAWDRDEALGLVRHFTTAFLLQTLNEDRQASAALAPAQVAELSDIDYAVSR